MEGVLRSPQSAKRMESVPSPTGNLNDEPLYRTWWKVWPFPRCCLPCNAVLHPCRAAVSQNKSRFRQTLFRTTDAQDGFDLDLTYVTNRIIVHGFPATGVEHLYRNPRTEVKRLLDTYHSDHYKVYNFANEPGRSYPPNLFQGRVERYPFADHTCPPLESVVDFCENAKAWLDTDESNVVSLHCKAGKGRAGIMAACLMVRMGITADDAVTRFDEKRASDTKGLTVVNQRKWVFMYERLVREVWGLQDSIGMVPGQDPDLRPPSARAASLREISVQYHPRADGKRGESITLPNLLCFVYQQRPMGKALVHKARMVQVAPDEGEPEMVLAATLPRSAWIEGTFQVIISAALGAASTQRNIMDLWWSTTFLDESGGNQIFELAEMDVTPLKLAARLQRVDTRIVLRHTHPDARSPPRRVPANGRSWELPAVDAEKVPSETLDPAEQQVLLHPSEEEILPLRTEESMRPVLPNGETDLSKPVNGVDVGEEPLDIDDKAIIGLSESGGSSQSQEVPVTSETEPAGESDGFPHIPPARKSSGIDGQETMAGKSPAYPGPSPAGWASPAWTFEGRMPSSGQGPSERSNGLVSDWRQRRMWSSGQIDDASTSTPPDGAPEKDTLPSHERGSGMKDKRHMLRKRSSQDSNGSGQGVVTARPHPGPQYTTTGSMHVPTGIVHPRSKVGVRAYGRREQGYGFPPYETESDSDDQLAVRASAFGGAGTAGAGIVTGAVTGAVIGAASGLEGHPEKGHYFASAGRGPPSSRSGQWVVEMEMAFDQERRRWLEHRRCLETELDWALAARARAEARSEEDSARVEVLEKRLSAWRGEYSMIERDVKQALPLLELSLSGLVSAENALKRWKDQIPSKAYEDIMVCLTNGDTSFTRADHIG